MKLGKGRPARWRTHWSAADWRLRLLLPPHSLPLSVLCSFEVSQSVSGRVRSTCADVVVVVVGGREGKRREREKTRRGEQHWLVAALRYVPPMQPANHSTGADWAKDNRDSKANQTDGRTVTQVVVQCILSEAPLHSRVSVSVCYERNCGIQQEYHLKMRELICWTLYNCTLLMAKVFGSCVIEVVKGHQLSGDVTEAVMERKTVGQR